MTTDDGLGPLAAALSKAQAAFPAILREKEVDSRAYTFKYAPLDAVLAAVREPLSQNGLAIAQILDGDDLVTLLLHEGGGRLEGRAPLPYKNGDTIQALGSAITYMRRYALQAILGIAAEEDDDGDRASKAGSKTAKSVEDVPEPSVRESEGGLIGIASLGKTAPVDGELRQTSDGPSIGFVLGEGREKVQVVARGSLAESLAPVLPLVLGQRVQVYGPVTQETLPPTKSGYVHKFLRVGLVQIKTDDWTMPPAKDAETLFPDEAEAAAILEAEKAEAAAG
jgi:hypothetical protein